MTANIVEEEHSSLKIEDVPAQFVIEQLNLILENEARNMADSVMRDDYDTEDLVFDSIREYARLYHMAQVEPYKAAVELERAYGWFPVHKSFSEYIIFEYQKERGDFYY